MFGKIFKSYSEKEVKRIMPTVEKINELEPEISKLSDSELRNKTNEFKDKLKNGSSLNDILPEAFAVCREASKRVLGMRHFDVQLIGGIILHQGRIAEMKTGEGKTLVATLPVYLNALTGEGVHVVTVNDYLAKRDSEWMGKLYRFLGLSVGLVISGMNPKAKKEAYACDITYGTNNEYGFDYLRDNMVIYKDQLVQRKLNFAIVDEIDSILIDEARTPLIISGRGKQSSDLYKKADKFVRKLIPKVIVEEDAKNFVQAEDNENYDYIVDLKAKSASLTQKGIKKAEEEFGLENFNDIENSEIVHNVNQALRAHGVMKKDIDYIVKDGEVLIVDEFTGRIMYGRRYNNGLHQAIEAKENVKIADESKTLATITFQNYFRMYSKLSGMTGTAMTEKDEFEEIYKLDVIAIPTNKEMIRKDNSDIIFKNENGKFRAVINDIRQSHEKGQPVLVGTISIEKSEKLSELLRKEGIKHEVLNAKYHEKEAEIIAQAGKYGAVTIATNMAGRGTDIMLGGNSEYLAKEEMRKLGYSEEQINQATAFNETDDQEIIASRNKFKELQNKYNSLIKEEKEKVIAAGGLKIIGTERHESRRIDNQLRGRSGRQGDPGESRFYIGLDDDLMKIFGGETITKLYDTLGADENMPIESKLISNSVESAQRRVEGRNFSIRKNVLNYDDVMNTQREIIYKQRREILDGEDLKGNVLGMIKSLIEDIATPYFADEHINKEGLLQELNANLTITELNSLQKPDVHLKEVIEEAVEKATAIYEERENEIGSEELRELERVVTLKVVDEKWMDHIDNMDELKDGIGLRAYGQKDPVVQYRIEGFDMFDQMVLDIKTDVVKFLMHARKREGDIKREETVKITGEGLQNSAINNLDGTMAPKTSTPQNQTVINNEPRIGRNDPCPCGSGKKYKNCCGK
ncbi:MAG TPA: preprotein translocase subunit SecA [Clostridiaceae bacterium]|jgi:preprotein translocase subunit SecA|nr:preprotein translocase subunit SecA [Clostridia bacterium]HCF65594.1 preprotein translocase subunit SecA [Clostridiales bacterium]HJJ09082.1 preprotein translocase subunit SecA [Clostridiaceae bacterium]